MTGTRSRTSILLQVAQVFFRPERGASPGSSTLATAVTEMEALRTGHDVPPWCRGHDLPYVWFAGSTPGLHAWALAHTPPSLGDRGVIIDGAALESV